MELKEKQCLSGRCDYYGKETLNEEGEKLTTIIRLAKTIPTRSHDTILGEWCSEECVIKDMTERTKK